jgi:rSAM/selenodomain-associated transferase 1
MQIAVIAKEPLAGRVKTRLCPPFSPAQAAELAEASLRDTLQAVRATPATRHVLVLEGRPGPWLPTGFDVLPQRGDDLGSRLAAAFEDCTATCGEPVVLVGMDTPQLTSAMVVDAGRLLTAGVVDPASKRAVIGPAEDGGYWLVALSHADPHVFDGVSMSASTTGAEQIAQLHRRGFDVRLTRSLRDVDTAVDAACAAAAAPGSAFARRLAALSCSPQHAELGVHV